MLVNRALMFSTTHFLAAQEKKPRLPLEEE